MRKIKMSKRKILSLVAVALLTGILLVGGTVALFRSSTGDLNNVLKFGKVNIGVMLSGNGTTYEDEPGNLVISPQNISQGVCIKNINSVTYPTVDTYVRVRIVTVWRDAAGNGTGVQVNPTFNYVSNKWVLIDGYYYYNEALSPDEISAVFVNGVSFDKTGLSPTGYLDIQVLADGVIANPTAVSEAWGASAATLLNH